MLIAFTSCKEEKEEIKVKKEIFTGFVQKGPFVNGSTVTIIELNSSYDQTGKTYHTNISGTLGEFEQRNIELVSNYVELRAEGYYFNEIGGQTSSSPLTLTALTDIEGLNSANVNVLTHLEKSRTEYLVKQQNMSFANAKRQAHNEVLAIFDFEQSESLSESLNLTSDAELLAISCILQGQISTGDMEELMADISNDIKSDGILTNTALGTKLMNNAFSIQQGLSAIRSNLEEKYAGTGVSIPDFETKINAFINSDKYPLTLSITYPATGQHGVNILSDEVTEIQMVDEVPFNVHLSMKAEVPAGLSLKVVLRRETWSNSYAPWASAPVSDDNWTITTYNTTAKTQEFEVTNSGVASDILIGFNNSDFEPPTGSIFIDYYENGATTPTRTKELIFNVPVHVQPNK